MTQHWLGAFALFAVLFILDLRVFHQRAHILGFKEALLYTSFWISVALLFNGYIYFSLGAKPAIDFFTGYLVEYSLSVDNLFVFMLIFSYFKVPEQYQQRVLFFGIVGAVLMRGIFILLGATLLEVFHWSIYLFGLLLVYSGIKLFFQSDDHLEPEKNFFFRTAKRVLPIYPQYVGQSFYTIHENKFYVTPLFLVLVSVEISDLIFAVDSIPAIFGITKDPYIIFTSNIFAVLGLRSLYFLLARSMNKVALLKYGLALILIFVGLKMLTESIFPISNILSLGVIITILIGSLICSLIYQKNISNKSAE